MKGSNLFLAKWAILVFVGFSTILSTHLRAYDSVPSGLRVPLAAAKKALAIDIQFDGITDSENIKGAQNLLTVMANDSFVRSYRSLREECRIEKVLKTIIVGTGFRLLSGGVYLKLDATQSAKSQQGLIDLAVSNCGLAYSAIDGMTASYARAGLARRAINTDVEALVENRVKGRDIESWSNSVSSKQSQEQFELFEHNCGVTIDSIQFGTATQIAPHARKKHSSTQLFIDARSSSETNAGILEAAQACGKIYPLLRDLNANKALNRGLYLFADVSFIFTKSVTSEHVANWVKYFNDDTQRLIDLRSVVLGSSKPNEFSALKKCVKNQTPFDSSCGAPIMVNLNVTTSFLGGENLWFQVMLVSMTGMTGVAANVKAEESIFLDVTSLPGIPSSIPR